MVVASSKLEALTALLDEDRQAVWDHEEAVELCGLIEKIAPRFGCHVALTGGCLYKPGRRKDADIMFYRIRQVERIDEVGLFAALATELNMEIVKRWGWVIKATWRGKPVDLFFPEHDPERDRDALYQATKEALTEAMAKTPDDFVCPEQDSIWPKLLGDELKKHCLTCGVQLIYWIANDSWIHPKKPTKSNPASKTPDPMQIIDEICALCRQQFHYIERLYQPAIGKSAGWVLCPECADKVRL